MLYGTVSTNVLPLGRAVVGAAVGTASLFVIMIDCSAGFALDRSHIRIPLSF
jgi:hypothetical protein